MFLLSKAVGTFFPSSENTGARFASEVSWSSKAGRSSCYYSLEDCTNASQFMLLQLPISTVRRESFQMCKSPDTSQRGPSQKIIHTDMFVMLRVYLESVLALETGTRGFVVGTKL